MKKFLTILLGMIFLASCQNAENPQETKNISENSEKTAQITEKRVELDIEKNYPITTEVEKISQNSLENRENTLVVKPRLENVEQIFFPMYIGANSFAGDILAPLRADFSAFVESKNSQNIILDIFSPNTVSGALLLGSSTGENWQADAIDKNKNAENANDFSVKYRLDTENLVYPNNSVDVSVNADIHHEKYIEKIVVDLSEIRQKMAKMEKMDTPEYLTIATSFDLWNKAILADMTDEEIDFYVKNEENYDFENMSEEDKKKLENISARWEKIREKMRNPTDAEMMQVFFTTADGVRHDANEESDKFYVDIFHRVALVVQDFELAKNIVSVEFVFPPLPSELKISPKYKDRFTIRRPDFSDAKIENERFGIFSYPENPLKLPKNSPEKDAVTFALTADKIDENTKIDRLSVGIDNFPEHKYSLDYRTISGSLVMHSFIASPELEGKNHILTLDSYEYPLGGVRPLGLFKSGFFAVQEPSYSLKRLYKKSGDWMYAQTKMTGDWVNWEDNILFDAEKMKNVKKFVLDFSEIKNIFSAENNGDFSRYNGFHPQFDIVVYNVSGLDNPNVEFFAIKSSGEKVKIPFEIFEEGKKFSPESRIL